MDSTIKHALDFKGWKVHTIHPDVTVLEAVGRMVELNVGSLVVTDGSGALQGIITERDYMREVILKGRASATTLVEEIMTRDVICVEPHATVKECLQLMTEHRCRHLPVIYRGAIRGLISIGDCARRVAFDNEIVVREFTNFIVGRYPC